MTPLRLNPLTDFLKIAFLPQGMPTPGGLMADGPLPPGTFKPSVPNTAQPGAPVAQPLPTNAAVDAGAGKGPGGGPDPVLEVPPKAPPRLSREDWMPGGIAGQLRGSPQSNMANPKDVLPEEPYVPTRRLAQGSTPPPRGIPGTTTDRNVPGKSVIGALTDPLAPDLNVAGYSPSALDAATLPFVAAGVPQLARAGYAGARGLVGRLAGREAAPAAEAVAAAVPKAAPPAGAIPKPPVPDPFTFKPPAPTGALPGVAAEAAPAAAPQSTAAWLGKYLIRKPLQVAGHTVAGTGAPVQAGKAVVNAVRGDVPAVVGNLARGAAYGAGTVATGEAIDRAYNPHRSQLETDTIEAPDTMARLMSPRHNLLGVDTFPQVAFNSLTQSGPGLVDYGKHQLGRLSMAKNMFQDNAALAAEQTGKHLAQGATDWWERRKEVSPGLRTGDADTDKLRNLEQRYNQTLSQYGGKVHTDPAARAAALAELNDIREQTGGLNIFNPTASHGPAKAFAGGQLVDNAAFGRLTNDAAGRTEGLTDRLAHYGVIDRMKTIGDENNRLRQAFGPPGAAKAEGGFHYPTAWTTNQAQLAANQAPKNWTVGADSRKDEFGRRVDEQYGQLKKLFPTLSQPSAAQPVAGALPPTPGMPEGASPPGAPGAGPTAPLAAANKDTAVPTNPLVDPKENAANKEQLSAAGSVAGAAALATSAPPPPGFGKYWNELPQTSKILAIAGASLAGIMMLRSMFGHDKDGDKEEEESFLMKALPFLGVAVAGWGLTGGTLSSLPEMKHVNNLGDAFSTNFNDLKGGLSGVFGGGK